MQAKCPIAVVGVSALFPGATNVTGFWHNIVAGRDEIREIPESYWLIDDFHDPDPNAKDKTYGKRGAFVDPVDFDCLAHGVLPAQVQDTDTVQLMGLIVAQSVLRDAARGDFAHLDRSRMSVILGCAGGTEQLVQMGSRLQRPVWLKSLREAGIEESRAQAICERIANHYVPWSEASFPGLLGNVVAGRIANRFDLGGTNCVVDAACASSSSALTMAVQELYLGDSDAVLAGGADALNDILMYMCFSKTPALSASGDCRPFSDQADGTILGEGVGMVALRRLADAERDGDTIYAVIQGVGSSSDGAGTAVYAPVSEGQAQAISRAYANADFDPATVELIEAHGTGTKAGDKAEFKGLELAFAAAERDDQQWCALGSVKSQIGHTKGAAGSASLIKTVLALHHKVLPPTIKVEQPNPLFAIEQSPFYINTEARPWIRDSRYPRRAGMSSFGFGGSNFHIAVEEYQGRQSEPRRIMLSASHLLLWSANSPEALFNSVRQSLDGMPDDAEALEYLARDSQGAFDAEQRYRLAFVSASMQQLGEQLAHCQGVVLKAPAQPHSSPKGWHYGHGAHQGKVALLFPGQGSQYLNMGAQLSMTFPAAREVWDQAADLALSDQASLHQRVFPIPVFSDDERQLQARQLNATEWAQPAIGATSLSQWALLQRMGLKADGMAGHSYGELTALHVAGAFDSATLLQLARKRGELMAQAAASQVGAMSAVAADRDSVQAILATLGDAKVVIANVNSPRQSVISGEVAAIEQAEQACAAKGLSFTRLPVATAFHSPVVDAALAPFADHLASIDFAALQHPVYANVTAQPYPEGGAEQRACLAQQLGSPVLFMDQIQAMRRDGFSTFIEVGPGNVLSNLAAACLKGQPHHAIALDRKNRPGLHSFWQALARLSALGLALDFSALWQGFREYQNPRKRPKAKLALPITGINYNRVYPPKEGASALPKPNATDTEVTAAIAAAAAATDAASPETAPLAPPLAAVAAERAPVSATPVHPPAAAVPPTSAPSAPAEAAWLAAFETIQRQTHESHRQFLQLSEQALGHLGQLLHGQAQPSQHSALPASPMATLPAAPPIAAPLEPVAPAPVPVAPVAPAPPVAPVAQSKPAAVSAPTAPTPQTLAAGAAPAPDINAVILDIVSEKTGYPLEMLTLGMDLEQDLGIDSIKRVEILAATTDRVDDMPPVEAAEMASLRTLGDVAGYIAAQLGQSTAATAIAPAAAPPAAPGVDVEQLMLEVVAEKTGYPIDMLEPGMDLENDLGIDSIKRVEILAATTDRVANMPPLEAAEMASLRTLGDVAGYIAAQLGQHAANQSAANGTGATTEAPSDAGAAADAVFGIHRYQVQLMPLAAPGLTPRALLDLERVVITPHNTPVAKALAKRLRARGLDAELRSELRSGDSQVICLEGLQSMKNIAQASAVNEIVFGHACAIAAEQERQGGLFVVLQSTGGDYGHSGSEPIRAWSGGLSGLAKTAAQEWPRALVRSIDLATQGRGAEQQAEAIVDELYLGAAQLEVALGADGLRQVPISLEAAPDEGELPLADDAVVVVSGGGRGVTAAAICALCHQRPLRVALLGRTQLDAEDAYPGVEGEAALMQAVLAKSKSEGQALSPPALKSAVVRILGQREIRATVHAIEASGSEAIYLACDINSPVSLDHNLAKIRQRWGHIDALVHGAGVLADKLLSGKKPEHFQRVFGTKVEGLQHLLAALRQDPLKLLCLFSSVAARTGNAGQSDYAMANEVLNRVAAVQQGANSATKVVSINWGPWQSGMVNAALKQKFADLGVALIPLRDGAERFVAELRHPMGQAVEVVIGGAALNRPLTQPDERRSYQFAVSADTATLPHLDSHRVRGKVVLPVVQVVDWFSAAINAVAPSPQDILLSKLSVLRGVSLDDDDPRRFTVVVDEAATPGCFDLSLIDQQGRKRYSASARFSASSERAGQPATEQHSAIDDTFDPYAERLFHGPLFAALEQVEGMDAGGASARLIGGKQLSWQDEGWRVDQALLDGALQLALLWGFEQTGHDTLPMSFSEMRIGHRGLQGKAARCTLQGVRNNAAGTQSDLWIYDDDGEFIASINGLEMFAVEESLQ